MDVDDLVRRHLPGPEPVTNLREQLLHRLVELHCLGESNRAVLRDLARGSRRLLEGMTQLDLSSLH